jgi:prophage regulatory protein
MMNMRVEAKAGGLGTNGHSQIAATSVMHSVDTPTKGNVRRFLRLREVMNRVPYSRATIYRKIGSSEFPRPFDLGGNGHGSFWLESEIEAWIDERIAAAGRQVA